MKRRMTKIWFVLSVGLVVALGFIAVKAADGDMMKSGNECTMVDMHKCTIKCVVNCDKTIKNTSEAMTLLDDAVSDIDAGNTADAKMKIVKAKMMLSEMQMAQKECMEKMPTCNAFCPISGKQIDMMNTPENLTRMYNGKKVGFCCPACLPRWENLTETEKDAKLNKTMPMMPEKESPGMPGKEEMMKNMPGNMKMQK